MGVYKCGFCKCWLETRLEAWTPRLAKPFSFLVWAGGGLHSHSYTVWGCWLLAAWQKLHHPWEMDPSCRPASANHTPPSLDAQDRRRFLGLAVVLFLAQQFRDAILHLKIKNNNNNTDHSICPVCGPSMACNKCANSIPRTHFCDYIILSLIKYLGLLKLLKRSFF